MALVTRILGLSLLTGGLGARLGYAFFGQYEGWEIASLLLACAGGMMGAVAGAAREIVIALRRRR